MSSVGENATTPSKLKETGWFAVKKFRPGPVVDQTGDANFSQRRAPATGAVFDAQVAGSGQGSVILGRNVKADTSQ